MLATLIHRSFLRAVQGESTEEEAADEIADALCANFSSSSLNQASGAQISQNHCSDNNFNISGSLQQQLQQHHQKILGTITLGDLQPSQIAQFKQAFTEASNGLSSSVVLPVQPQNTANSEDEFTDEDKERCSLLHELITGHRPLLLHPYVFLLNRRFKWTDIAVPVTETDKFRIYRLNQARNARCYYRCSGCETMAKAPGDPIAQIKLAEGYLAGDVKPVHNAKCELFTFSTIVNRQFDREARLDVYNGIMTPKEAWKRGRLKALRAESLAPKGLLNADDYPTWETMNKVIMKLWRSAKRAHEAGVETVDRFSSRDWWRNIPAPISTRRSLKRKRGYDRTNFTVDHTTIPFESGEIEDFDDDGSHSCISMATAGRPKCVEVVDVVSESEAYTTDQEPAPSASFETSDVAPEPPEHISLFTNKTEGPEMSVVQSNEGSKDAEVFVQEDESNGNVQYYLIQGDDDDDDDEIDDDDDADNGNDGGDDIDNDVDVDNDDQIAVDNIGVDENDEVMQEYRDILTEVQQLEREARAAAEDRMERQKLYGSRMVTQPLNEPPFAARRSIRQVTLRERAGSQQRLNNTFFANRKLFAAIESLTRTLNADHSRQFHQEMLKTAVELSNHYAAQQQQQYVEAAAAVQRNATAEHRNLRVSGSAHSHDDEDDDKSFGKVVGRRDSTLSQTWTLKKRPKFE